VIVKENVRVFGWLVRKVGKQNFKVKPQESAQFTKKRHNSEALASKAENFGGSRDGILSEKVPALGGTKEN